jgi:hypothetical protein
VQLANTVRSVLVEIFIHQLISSTTSRLVKSKLYDLYLFSYLITSASASGRHAFTPWSGLCPGLVLYAAACLYVELYIYIYIYIYNAFYSLLFKCPGIQRPEHSVRFPG